MTRLRVCEWCPAEAVGHFTVPKSLGLPFAFCEDREHVDKSGEFARKVCAGYPATERVDYSQLEFAL